MKYYSTIAIIASVILMSQAPLTASAGRGSLDTNDDEPIESDVTGRDALKTPIGVATCPPKDVNLSGDESEGLEGFSGSYQVFFEVKSGFINPRPSECMTPVSYEENDGAHCKLSLSIQGENITLHDFTYTSNSQAMGPIQSYISRKVSPNSMYGQAELALARFVVGILPKKSHSLKPITENDNLTEELRHFGVWYNANSNPIDREYPHNIAHIRLMVNPFETQKLDLFVERPSEGHSIGDHNSTGGTAFHFILKKIEE